MKQTKGPEERAEKQSNGWTDGLADGPADADLPPNTLTRGQNVRRCASRSFDRPTDRPTTYTAKHCNARRLTEEYGRVERRHVRTASRREHFCYLAGYISCMCYKKPATTEHDFNGVNPVCYFCCSQAQLQLVTTAITITVTSTIMIIRSGSIIATVTELAHELCEARWRYSATSERDRIVHILARKLPANLGEEKNFRIMAKRKAFSEPHGKDVCRLGGRIFNGIQWMPVI